MNRFFKFIDEQVRDTNMHVIVPFVVVVVTMFMLVVVVTAYYPYVALLYPLLALGYLIIQYKYRNGIDE